VAGYVRGARALARQAGRALTMQDLVDEVVPPSDLPEEDRWRACVHESGHAIACLVMRTGRLMSVSVAGQSRNGGGRVVMETAKGIIGPEAIDGVVVQALAGRAAEQLVFGSASGGAGGAPDSDLAKATSLVAAAHLSLGLRGSILYSADPQDALSIARRTPGVMAAIGRELDQHYATAQQLVASHLESILALARMVCERRVVSGEVARTIFDGLRPEGRNLDRA
jgi:ATP-dependent Zn protease